MYRDADLMAELRARQDELMRWALRLCLAIPVIIALIRGKSLYAHMNLWGHLYLSIAYSALLLAVLVRKDVPQLRSGVLQWAGRYSYSLYLFHPLVLSLVFVLAERKKRFDEWVDVGLAAVALALTIAFCVALYHVLERPLIDYGRARFSYRNGWVRARGRAVEADAK